MVVSWMGLCWVGSPGFGGAASAEGCRADQGTVDGEPQMFLLAAAPLGVDVVLQGNCYPPYVSTDEA
jgi:hypothetical protein